MAKSGARLPTYKPGKDTGWRKTVLDLNNHLPDELEPIAINVDVDWLTLTVKSREAREKLLQIHTETIRGLRDAGEELRQWKFKGYRGIGADGVKWGTRADSDICMLSGEYAGVFWQKFLPLAENVTRVDLAVTVETDRPCPDLLKYYYDWETETLKRGLKHQTRWRVTILENNFGGQTLYVGSRASDQMGRVYDKAAQQGMKEHIARLWRYEVEFKQSRALKVAEQLQAPGATVAKLRNDIRKTVFLWFSSRDVPPIFDASGDEFSLEVSAKITSDDMALAWFSSQVKPSVQRLIEKGLVSEVKEALGIAIDEKSILV